MFSGVALAIELWLAAGLLATLMMAADVRWNLDADDRRGFTWGDVMSFGLLSVFLGPISLVLALFLAFFNARYWLTLVRRRGARDPQ